MRPPRPGRAVTVNVTIAAVLVIALAVGYLALRPTKGTASTGQQRTATAIVTDVTATVSATGTSEPVSTSQVSFATSGTIDSIRVHAGSVVKKGQVLATVDEAGLKSAVDVAQAKDDAAQSSYSAAVESYDNAVAGQSASSSTATAGQGQNASSGQSSVQSVESASAQLSSAKAARLQATYDLQAAEAAVAAATLRSPLAGTVLTVNGSVGGSASGGGSGGGGASGASSSSSTSTALFTIADLSRMQVSASFAEADAMQLKVGQAATTVFNAATGDPVSGKITSVAPTPTTSSNVVSYAVTVSLPQLPKGLRPGQTATVTVTTGSRQNVLAVPSAAISGSGSNHTVTVVSGGRETTTAVEVGLEGDQWTEIRSGLSEGQQVVLTTAASSGSSTGFPGGGQFPGGRVGGGAGGLGGVGGQRP